MLQALLADFSSSSKSNTNLSKWPTVVHRVPTRNYLHNKDSKTINITPLVQHTSAGVFRSYITKIAAKCYNKYLSHVIISARNFNEIKPMNSFNWIVKTDPNVPITRVVT